MEIILKQDITGLGYKNDLLTVKDGYARNYLIPKGVAVIATPSEKKQLVELKKQQSFKEEKIRKEADAIVAVLNGITVNIGVKAGVSGKLFGSVTSIIVADAIKKQTNIDIDRRHIVLDENIKEVGTHKAKILLHKDIECEVLLELTAE